MKMTITVDTEADGHEAPAQYLAGPNYAVAAHRYREKLIRLMNEAEDDRAGFMPASNLASSYLKLLALFDEEFGGLPPCS